MRYREGETGLYRQSLKERRTGAEKKRDWRTPMRYIERKGNAEREREGVEGKKERGICITSRCLPKFGYINF